MKFSTDAAALAATLKEVAAVLPARPVHPTYGLVLIENDRDDLALSATDGNHRITCHCKAEGVETGSACLGGAALVATASSMSGCVTIFRDGNDVILSDGGGTSSLRVADLDPDAFPQGDEGLETRCAFALSGGVLSSLLKVVVTALPRGNTTLPGQLDGVAFDLDLSGDGADLGLVASDSMRVAAARTAVTGVFLRTPPGGVAPTRYVATLVPEAAEIVAALASGDKEVTLTFSSGLGTLRGELFRYTFPLSRYERHLDWRTGHPALVVGGPSCDVDAASLRDAVTRALSCVKDEVDSQSVLISGAPGSGLTLSCRGTSGRTEVRCPELSSRGEAPYQAKVGGKFLLQHLRAWGDGPLSLTFVGAGTASAVSSLRLQRDRVMVALAGRADVAQSSKE